MKPREQIVKEVAALLGSQKYLFQVDMYLKKEQVEEADYDAIKKEARAIYEAQSRKQRRILWSAIAVFIFVLFYFLIPNSISNLAPMIIALIGAVIFSVFLVQAIGDFESIEHFNGKTNKPLNATQKAMPVVLIVSVLAMGVVFYLNFRNSEKEELKAHGEIVKGTITDGSVTKIRRSKNHEVTVKFEAKNGKVYVVTESVSEAEFRQIYKGMQVDVLYSTKDPFIVELLLGDNTKKEFTQSEERELNVQDLIEMLSLESDEALGVALNKISYGWEYNKEEAFWMNESRKIALSFQPSKEIKWIGSGLHMYPVFIKELKKMNFKKNDNIENKKGMSFFYSDDFLVLLELMTDKDFQHTRITIEKIDKSAEAAVAE